ncbi:MAG TPA: carboxypeptidase-like regulatory domain-containing protein, partial [Flavisolibacter sp.]|nr:carboxypeptidase-like regulatory domain-containing protein [Flavisolibacter sp.]
MKNITILTAFLLLSAGVFAQFPVAGGGGKGAQSIPNLGHVYGKLLDSTGKPVSNASVVILQNKYDTVNKKRKDVLLKGVATKVNGEFSFEELPIMGPLKVKISAIGFKPYEQTVSFQLKMAGGGQRPSNGQAPDMSAISNIASAFERDLGNIVLKPAVNELNTVVVSATSGRLKMDIDKKVFNVDKNLVSAGGTALDVMKNVPSVQVDIDGNVKLRNSTPQIYIEGRPTTLSLDQIPAD